MKATPIRLLLVGAAIMSLFFALPAWAQEDEEIGGLSEGDSISEDELDTMEQEEQETVEMPVDNSKGVVTYWGEESLKDVEKGFFMDARFGYSHHFGGLGEWVDGGLLIGGGIGYDILDELSLELDVLSASHASADLFNPDTGYRFDDAKVSGDSISLWVPLVIHGHYHVLKRLSIGGALQGGIYYNNKVIKGYKQGVEESGKAMDFFGGARLSIEYYAGLRHISLGFDIDVNYLIEGKSVVLNMMPMVKYTF